MKLAFSLQRYEAVRKVEASRKEARVSREGDPVSALPTGSEGLRPYSTC